MYRLWRIAVRDLRRNKRRSALTMIAVMLGLALVIALHSYEMGAMETSIKNNIRVQTGHVQVRAESYDEEKVSLKWEDLLQEPQALAAQAQMLPNVRDAAPVLWGSGILNTVDESVGLRVYGVDPLAETTAPFREGLVVGAWLAPDDRSGILVSRRLAETMGLAVGDGISLLVNTSDEQPDEAIFEIRGLYDSGIPGFDDVTVFLPLAKAQAFMGVGDRASAVVAVLEDQEDADAVAAALSASGLEVLTWSDLNEMMLTLTESAMGILYLFYGIVMAIVAVVVANTLLMSVFERTREMGILASLGMKGRQIMGMFLMESATLGLLGILLGVGLGSLGAYYLVNVGISLGDLDISDVAGTGSGFALGNTLYGTYIWGDTAMLAVACLIIILLASLYPAWFATRKEPIDALRTF
ncbi:MAG TPA: FtsX-like permease family protein [Anaerolineae bacterium]|nr:FtsX-like permease family protein [Anaerolineae bacterium]